MDLVDLRRFSLNLSMVDRVSNTQPCHEMNKLLVRRKHKFYKKASMQVDLNNFLEIIKCLQNMPSGPLKYMFFASFEM